MDRRAALKKLGAGSAIAGAALVVPTFDVAHAASGTGTPAAPPNPSNGWVSFNDSNDYYVVTLPVDGRSCSLGGQATATVTWTILSFDPVLASTLFVTTVGNTTITQLASSASGSSTAAVGPPAVHIRRNPYPESINLAAFSVRASVVWTCNGQNPVTRNYTISRGGVFGPGISVT